MRGTMKWGVCREGASGVSDAQSIGGNWSCHSDSSEYPIPAPFLLDRNGDSEQTNTSHRAKEPSIHVGRTCFILSLYVGNVYLKSHLINWRRMPITWFIKCYLFYGFTLKNCFISLRKYDLNCLERFTSRAFVLSFFFSYSDSWLSVFNFLLNSQIRGALETAKKRKYPASNFISSVRYAQTHTQNVCGRAIIARAFGSA